MRPLRLAPFVGAVIVAITLTASSCEEAPAATLGTVGRASVTEVVDAPASVNARAAAALTSPAEGTLLRVAVNPGQQVAKGQILAVIDSPSAQARLKQAKQALDAAKRSGGGSSLKVNFGKTQSHLDKTAAEAFAKAREAASHIADPTLRAALLLQITTAEQQYAAASKAVSSATKAVQQGIAGIGSAMSALGAAQKMQAQQAYDLARSTVDALTLKAPFAGVVQLGGSNSSPGTGMPDIAGLLGGAGLTPPTSGSSTPAGVTTTVGVGAPVSAGTAILTVVDVSELSLVAEVDETDIFLVKPGISATAELDAAPGETFPATVRAIDMLPTSNSRGAVAYRVHLILTGSGENQPRPGMSAVVKLQVRQADNTVVVPAAAVFTSDGKDTVWVRRDDGTAERRQVKVGVSGTDMLQITDGLREGERIVVRGADKVHEGDQLP